MSEICVLIKCIFYLHKNIKLIYLCNRQEQFNSSSSKDNNCNHNSSSSHLNSNNRSNILYLQQFNPQNNKRIQKKLLLQDLISLGRSQRKTKGKKKYSKYALANHNDTTKKFA